MILLNGYSALSVSEESFEGVDKITINCKYIFYSDFWLQVPFFVTVVKFRKEHFYEIRVLPYSFKAQVCSLFGQ